MGAKKRPTYRIVAAESTSPRDGRIIESLGNYDPISEPVGLNINEERAKYWLSVGAQPSDTVAALLRKQGILPAKTA
jgi:small subunit ribosomal protein S16